ncbi:MAG: hypothetical protein IKQ60_00130 [Candidatus Methanomethylophilaceae archaeon]|nr:hypothetical protein [Candidatus Methanomethylophilaceae archaeon]
MKSIEMFAELQGCEETTSFENEATAWIDGGWSNFSTWVDGGWSNGGYGWINGGWNNS